MKKENDAKRLCAICKKEILPGKKAYFSEKGIYFCESCIDGDDSLAHSTQQCPACKETVCAITEGVMLALTPIGSSEEQTQHATETLIVVCPHCHVMFFDNYHFQLLQALGR